MANDRLWYAVMRDREDNDWGYGSYDLDEAKAMARKMRDNGNEDAYIDIVNDGYYDDDDGEFVECDPISVGVITDLD